jgi:acetyltransferase-like isoleucine patch superfamily enzyme
MSSDRRNAEYLDRDALIALGFAALGKDVLIHPSCVLIECSRIHLGDHVRIDPFCLISAGDGLVVGSRVHIGSHTSIVGGAGVHLGDFSGLSQGVQIFAASDDYTGPGLIGPTVSKRFRDVKRAPVRIEPYAILGAQSVALPGAHLGEGATVGALSLVKGALAPWTLHAGVPAKPIGPRHKEGVLAAAAAFAASLTSTPH